MKFKRFLALLLLTAVFFQSLSIVASCEGDEMRGIWVSTVLNLDYPTAGTTSEATLKQQADEIISGCKSMGINNIFLQVRPCSDAFYKSNIYPWSMYLTGTQGTAPENGFDPLEYWISTAHSSGIKVHAWINPYRVTKNNDANDTELKSLAANNPAVLNPDYIIKYTDNQYYFDPGLPEVRSMLVEGALEIVNNYDIDGIHMDDYFYPGTGFDDSVTFAKYGSGFTSIEAWRRNNVDLLIKELNTQLHAADPDILFGVSPTGIWANKSTMAEGSDTTGNESYTSYFADTRKWAQSEWLDYIAPQIYWNIGYTVADYQVLANWWAEQLADCSTKLYIGMATYRSSGASETSVWYGTDEISRQLALNRQISKISGEIHFRYGLVKGNSTMANFLTSYYGSGTSSSDTVTEAATEAVTQAQTEAATEAVTEVQTEATTSAPVNINFNDMTAYYNWAKEAVETLAAQGVVSGVGHNNFAPADNVRRADFLLMLVNVLGLEGEYSDNFSDVAESKYYANAVGTAKALGVVSGTGSGKFDPEGYITRQDMMVMTEKALSLKANLADANLSVLDKFADASSVADYAKQSTANLVLINIVSGSKGRLNPQSRTTRAESAVIIYKIYKLFDI
ncbi:MAG: family 10 glycosylhydrolase [Clostridiales bacterium]|nr:family 10 glycosylhydrolase [Clostridiales bacterium]